MSSLSDFKFIAFLNELDLSLDLDSFESRLLLQKRMYLAQWLGLNLNLRYGWYIHGPYSTDLSHMAYRLQKISQDSKIQDLLPNLSKDEKKKVSEAKRLFAVVDKLGKNVDYWYELVASLIFLKESNYPKPSNNKEVASVLEEKKTGKFRQPDVEKALSLIKR